MSEVQPSTPLAGEKVRLQKVLAHAGVTSRRQAEELIVHGRVKVNGQVVTQLGTKVQPGVDTVEVDGVALGGEEAHEYYLLNKPVGYVTTVRDPQHRPTVMRLLPSVEARVYPVGRLDQDSEGLLLMTNDGELAHRLTHPRFGIEKEYLVAVAGRVPAADLDRIRRGVESQGEQLRPRSVEVSKEGSERTQVSVVLTEGRKREVRRMFEAVGRAVLSLVRVRFGPIRLGDLPPGHFRALTKDEIEQLRAITSA